MFQMMRSLLGSVTFLVVAGVFRSNARTYQSALSRLRAEGGSGSESAKIMRGKAQSYKFGAAVALVISMGLFLVALVRLVDYL